MPISPDTKLRLVRNLDDAAEFMRWLGQRRDGPVCFDVETTGLDPITDRIRLVQFGDKMHGWAMQFEQPGSWGALAMQAFEAWEGEWVAHNSNYDDAMLRQAGIQVPRHRVRDTRLMAAVLEPEYNNGLKPQAARHVDKKAAGASKQLDEVMTKNGWTWATIPIDSDPSHEAAIYWVYGGLDCVLTAHLYDVHMPQVQAICPKAYDLEEAVAWICRDMSNRGMLCDREFTQQKYDAFTKYVAESAAYIKQEYGFSHSDSAAIAEYLQANGAVLTKKTDGGKWSLDRSVLEEFADTHPLAATLLKRRRTEKVASSFLKPFLAFSERDGYLRPNINSVGGSNKSVGESGGEYGVRTGRMSLSGPNLSALPRADEGNPVAEVVRQCIIAEDGRTFVKSDLDQIEVRLLAHFVNSAEMKQSLKEADSGGLDFFTSLARSMYRDDSIVKSNPIRNRVKSSMYATSYGSGVPKFAATAGISIDEAAEIVGRLHRTYPDLKRYMKHVESLCKTQGYVPSQLTGRRHKPDEGFAYKGLNYEIQGTAAEIFKMQIVELDAAGVGQYLRLPVHDEVTLCCPDEEVPEVARIVHSVMNNSTLLSVPITAGVVTGKRWSSKQEYTL